MPPRTPPRTPHRTPLRRRGPVAAALVTVLAAGALAGAGGHPATAAESPDGPPAAPHVRATDGRTVTLITGDRVRLDADGEVVAMLPAEDRKGIPVRFLESREHTYVIPQDAAPLVHSGAVDRRLFDVTELNRVEHRRANQDAVPFIVEYAGEKPAAQPRLHQDADPTLRRTFSRLAAEALSTVPERATDVWNALTRTTDTGARTLASGVKSLRLDGVVRASLDNSVPRIGAPDAWDAGYDGTGITVAVLDTGIDTSHPDLADGKVVAEENFSGAEDTADRQGHGTHVASTVAGTGAKSEGRFTGVAPGARLLNGKVLDDDGFGDESGIIAGMEWAVEQGADVVNLSLGGTDAPGVDLMEETVNTLSAEHGTLFVIAAGNSGPGKGTVGSPGSADAALTVGAVDDEDALADFSSVGPRVGDGAVKPDLTAPGVDIAAALAEDSALAEQAEPVADGYAALSGTSMATPHVAGSAALLAQQHPDWTGEQIKAALTGSAEPGDSSVFQQGSGRVNVTDAIGQSVVAEPNSLSFGTVAWPHEDDEPVTRELTYRNLGDTDVTLDLTAESTGPDGEAAPEGMFTLSADQVTVPAGATAAVEVTADTTLGGSLDGTYGVLISGSGDGQTVRTAGGVVREEETHELTVRATDRDGQVPQTWYPNAMNHETGEIHFFEDEDKDGQATVRLPVGTYALESVTTYLDDAGEWVTGYDWQVQPKLDFTADTEVLFDGGEAQPIDVTVPDQQAEIEVRNVSYAVQTDGGGVEGSWLSDVLPDGFRTRQVGPSEPIEGLHSEVTATWTSGENTQYRLGYGQSGSFYTGLSESPGKDELAEVTVHQGSTAEDREGVLFTSADTGAYGGALTTAFPEPLPRTVTQFVNTDGVRWSHELWQLGADGDIETAYLGPARQYTAGESHRETFNVGVFGPTVAEGYGLHRTGNTLHGLVSLLADGAGHLGTSTYDTASTTLYRNGAEYATVDEVLDLAEFTVPEEEAEYRLESTLSRSGVASVSTSVTVSYTFTSGFVDEEETVELPVSAVRFTPELGSDSTAEAGASLQVPVTVEGSAADGDPEELTVSVSFDGGESWEPLAVRDGQVTVANPQEAGIGVSFRAETTDGDGNEMVQTIIDAYRTAAA